MFDPDHVPRPLVFTLCRAIADEETICKLIRRLAWEGKLAAYGRDNLFFRLILLKTQAGWLDEAAG